MSVLLPQLLYAIVWRSESFFLIARRGPRSLGLVVLCATFAIVANFVNGGSEFPMFIKTMAEVPLGLGSLALFGCLDKAAQKRFLPWFTWYVNLAVLGNIGMMVFVPLDGTLRGVVSKFSCGSLVIWLAQMMAAIRWRTVCFENGVFIFLASPLRWIMCHAVYRMVLVSSPSFASFKYVVTEPTSISVMYMYYYSNPQLRRPVNSFFGAADTLIVATVCTCSNLKLFDLLVPSETLENISLVPKEWAVFCDIAGVCIQLLVTIYSVKQIAQRAFPPK
mmetsp:Transcript_36914/g.60030  ORF Transcript_36914/g.60030 Transcript_36914/m.60030 type:complete len:277 (+) Transcript_36914:4119-4949(+)